jgi:hypothetical protein
VAEQDGMHQVDRSGSEVHLSWVAIRLDQPRLLIPQVSVPHWTPEQAGIPYMNNIIQNIFFFGGGGAFNNIYHNTHILYNYMDYRDNMHIAQHFFLFF